MAIRKLETIHDLKELNLKRETLRTLKAVSVNAQELVIAARNDLVWQTYLPGRSCGPEANQLTKYPGIGEVRAKEIIAAIDEAGFILHESEASRKARRLVASIFGEPQIFIEHYEDLEDMTPEALKAVDELIHVALTDRELQVIELRFGFKDEHFLKLQECADILGTTKERVRQLEFKALARLRHHSRRSKLEIATCYSQEALARRMAELWSDIGKLQMELDALKIGNPYSEIAAEVDGMPIDNLDFSVRTFNCLRRAGIHTVGELRKCTDNDLVNIRNFGTKNVDEVRKVLLGMGLTLAS